VAVPLEPPTARPYGPTAAARSEELEYDRPPGPVAVTSRLPPAAAPRGPATKPRSPDAVTDPPPDPVYERS
jgi:hypothetical protein